MKLKKGTLVPGKEKKSRLPTAIFYFSNLATLETTIFLPHPVRKAKRGISNCTPLQVPIPLAWVPIPLAWVPICWCCRTIMNPGTNTREKFYGNLIVQKNQKVTALLDVLRGEREQRGTVDITNKFLTKESERFSPW